MASAPERPDGALPLTQDEVTRLFDPLTGTDAVALGVSGGPDSLALLYLFNDWRLRTNWTGNVLVLTVDHGLRTGSAEEARAVSAHCARLGLEHRTLVWGGEKPASNIQAAARDARYRLMAQEMGCRGMGCLVLAHHRDDQVETFLDRLTRGSGVYGLGAMAPDQPNGPHGLRLLRPLLTLPKARLIADLDARGISWADDPSNRNPDYKRVRLRTMAALLAEEGLEPDRLAATARRLRRAAAAIDAWVANVWQTSVSEHLAGPLRLEYAVLAGLPQEVRLRLLARMIRRVTGRDTPLRLSKLELLEDRILTGQGRQTLSGAIVQRQAAGLFVWREAGRERPASLRLAAGAAGIWDDRYGYSRNPGGPGDRDGDKKILLGALDGVSTGSAAVDWPADWPKASFACAPALRCDGELLFVPGLVTGAGSEILSEIKLCRLPDRVSNGAVPTQGGQEATGCIY